MAKSKSSYIMELERRANDLLRVYNPTDKDYVVQWDRGDKGVGVKLFRINSKTEKVFPRYIAMKYVREMYDKIMAEKLHAAIFAENETRIAKGVGEMDKTLKTGEQMNFETKFLADNEQNAKKILSILFLGVDSEYGIDEQVIVEDSGPVDDRPAFDRILDDIENSSYNSQQTKQPEPEEPKKQEVVYKCDFPGCQFESQHKLALAGHKRSHITKTEAKKSEALKGVSK